MARATFVLRNGRLIEKYGPDDIRVKPARSGLPCPMLIRDGNDGVRSMVDGKVYDSNSALRASYRAAGVEEMGNDAPITMSASERSPVTAADVGEAYQMVRNGYKPAPLDTTILPEG